MSTFSESVYEPQCIVLGILGSVNKISEQELQKDVLHAVLQKLGRLPDKVLIPSEGNSSIYIGNWAETLHIKTQVFYADWYKNKKMVHIRDDKIQKESTHVLVFLTPRSIRLEKVANKLAQKGKHVFTSLRSQTQTKFEVLNLEPVRELKASKPVHKLDIGKGQTLLKFQKITEY